MIVSFVGFPFSGKDDAVRIAVQSFPLLHISSSSVGSAMKRQESEATTLGQRYVERGELVPPKVLADIVTELVGPGPEQALLDGLPATAQQAVALSACGVIIDALVVVTMSADTLESRRPGLLAQQPGALSRHDAATAGTLAKLETREVLRLDGNSDPTAWAGRLNHFLVRALHAK